MEDDLGQVLKIVHDQRESADIENLLQELRDNIVLAAERPEQPCERDVDPDQDGGQKADVGSEKAEAAVNVSDERLHELIDDIESVHIAASSCSFVVGAGGRIATAAAAPATGQLSGLGSVVALPAPRGLMSAGLGPGLAGVEAKTRPCSGFARAPRCLPA